MPVSVLGQTTGQMPVEGPTPIKRQSSLVSRISKQDIGALKRIGYTQYANGQRNNCPSASLTSPSIVCYYVKTSLEAIIIGLKDCDKYDSLGSSASNYAGAITDIRVRP